jgi:RNA polymerase sigma-70 factor, ECF subfamily
MIDHKTIIELKNKNEAAFEYVYHKTKRGVYAMIFSIVKSHPTAEDIMQDVYMKMMTSIDQYQSKTNFYNWILTIAKNQAIDYYRRQKKQIYVDNEDYDSTLTSNEQTPDQQSEFELMIEMLNQDQRSVVLLKIVDNMKFKEIAKVLDKPLGTVLWIYQEALKVLKSYEGI